MDVFLSFYYQLLLIFLTCILAYYLHFKITGSKYWKNRNVFNEEPLFLLGNNWRMLFTENVGFIYEKRYKKWKDKKLVGFWSFIFPALLVTDLDLIKRILVRDFNYFRDRTINVNEKRDPLAGHLVNLKGSKWRNLRVKLTPTFTSGKIKNMFPIMVDCGKELQNYLSKLSESEEIIEFKELFGRFTTDIISSCAFGIKTNSINNPDSEFRKYGKKIFEPGFIFVVRFILTSFFPFIRDALGLRSIPKDISDFFINVVRETMDYREKNNVKRNDFLDLLIELKNKGKIDDIEKEDKNKESLEEENQKFTLNQAAAQAFVFFAAGFETSSTTLSFAIYELAINPDIQLKLQKEIDYNLEKNNQILTYNAINEMEYLDCFIQGKLKLVEMNWRGQKENLKNCTNISSLWAIVETLRKYPPLALIARQCTADYEIPEMGVKLEKGTRVIISLLGIQRDPQYFPEPDVFNPDRFLPEEKAKRDHFTSLPFGEGPRNCIGARFGLLQTKLGIVSVLEKYTVKPSPETSIPLEFNKKSFILSPEHGIRLKITKR